MSSSHEPDERLWVLLELEVVVCFLLLLALLVRRMDDEGRLLMGVIIRAQGISQDSLRRVGGERCLLLHWVEAWVAQQVMFCRCGRVQPAEAFCCVGDDRSLLCLRVSLAIGTSDIDAEACDPSDRCR